MYAPPTPIIRTSMMVMTALPTTTNGLRARSDRFGGGGTCSGSSAARGLRGEMGGLSLMMQLESCRLDRGLARFARAECSLRPHPGFSTEYGEPVDRFLSEVSWSRAA